MKLLELDATEISTGYYDPSADRNNARKPNDTRKPLLTLRHVNRLKKMRAMQKLEKLKKQDVMSIMYGIPADDAGGGGGSPF